MQNLDPGSCVAFDRNTPRVLLQFVRVRTDGNVFVDPFVALAVVDRSVHLFDIGGGVPPGLLDSAPYHNDYYQHDCAHQNAAEYSPRPHGHEQGKSNVQAQQPAPGQLYESQLGEVLPENKAKGKHQQCGCDRPGR